jgi:gas vesicle protein
MDWTERLIISASAFVGGIAVGMLFAPEKGEQTRRRARIGARRTGRWLSQHVEETQQSILDVGDEAAKRLRKAAQEAVDRYIPDVVGDDDSWQEVYSSTAKDVEDEKR